MNVDCKHSVLSDHMDQFSDLIQLLLEQQVAMKTLKLYSTKASQSKSYGSVQIIPYKPIMTLHDCFFMRDLSYEHFSGMRKVEDS
jgi:hypothetical protein